MSANTQVIGEPSSTNKAFAMDATGRSPINPKKTVAYETPIPEEEQAYIGPVSAKDPEYIIPSKDEQCEQDLIYVTPS